MSQSAGTSRPSRGVRASREPPGGGPAWAADPDPPPPRRSRRPLHAGPAGDLQGGRCTGPTVTVDAHGKATVTVAANDPVAFDIGDLVRR
jgi:hypothetical protein